jgi:hypothetical protein
MASQVFSPGDVQAKSVVAAQYRIDEVSPAFDLILDSTRIVPFPSPTPPTPATAFFEATFIEQNTATSSLSIGPHLLQTRFQDSDGIWSYWDLSTQRPVWFEVTGDQHLTGAEYFIDTDPGPGMGVPILLPADGLWDERDEDIDVEGIDTSSLSVGSHILFIRARDADGNWGKIRLAPFEVAPPLVIQAAEWVTDPNTPPGGGNPMMAADGSFDSATEELTSDPIGFSDLPHCQHHIYVRVQDNLTRWSSRNGWGPESLVSFNRCPYVVSATPEFGNVILSTGPPVTFTVDAEDDDCDPLDYSFTIDGGPAMHMGGSIQFTPDAPPGSHEIAVVVTDGTCEAPIETWQIEVVSYTPTPSATFTRSPTPTQSQTPTITRTVTRTPTPTHTLSPTFGLTPTPTISSTPTITNTTAPTSTRTRTQTSAPTNSPTPTKTGTPTPTPNLSLADAVDNSDLVWTSSGNTKWFRQTQTTHDGQDAAQSGAIGNSQSSTLETQVNGPGALSFWWKVSSEVGSDKLTFLIDGQTPPGSSVSGLVDWVQKSLLIGGGTHNLKWVYSKDNSQSQNLDHGWVDQVIWQSSAPSPTPSATAAPTPPPRLVSVKPNDQYPMRQGPSAIELEFSADMDQGIDPGVIANRKNIASDTAPISASIFFSASPGWVASKTWLGAANITNMAPNGPYRVSVSGAHTDSSFEIPEDHSHWIRVGKVVQETIGQISFSSFDSLLVTWTIDPGLKGVPPSVAGSKIFRATQESGPYEFVSFEPAPRENYLDSGLTAETDYFYQVVVFNAAFEEVQRTPVIQGRTEPKIHNGYARTLSDTVIETGWTASDTPDIMGYRIEHSLQPAGPFALVASVPHEVGLATYHYTDTDLSPSTTYYYDIKEIDSSLNSSDLVQSINATTADKLPNPLDAKGLLALIRAIRGGLAPGSDLVDQSLRWK